LRIGGNERSISVYYEAAAYTAVTNFLAGIPCLIKTTRNDLIQTDFRQLPFIVLIFTIFHTQIKTVFHRSPCRTRETIPCAASVLSRKLLLDFVRFANDFNNNPLLVMEEECL